MVPFGGLGGDMVGLGEAPLPGKKDLSCTGPQSPCSFLAILALLPNPLEVLPLPGAPAAHSPDPVTVLTPHIRAHAASCLHLYVSFQYPLLPATIPARI